MWAADRAAGAPGWYRTVLSSRDSCLASVRREDTMREKTKGWGGGRDEWEYGDGDRDEDRLPPRQNEPVWHTERGAVSLRILDFRSYSHAVRPFACLEKGGAGMGEESVRRSARSWGRGEVVSRLAGQGRTARSSQRPPWSRPFQLISRGIWGFRPVTCRRSM